MAAVDRTVVAGHPVAVDLMEAAGLTEAARAAITGKCRPADTRVPELARRSEAKRKTISPRSRMRPEVRRFSSAQWKPAGLLVGFASTANKAAKTGARDLRLAVA